MDSKHIMAAVHQLDLNALSAEKVDILTRILPTEDEKKQYAEHADLESLGDEVEHFFFPEFFWKLVDF